jgi:hypothetical protein
MKKKAFLLFLYCLTAKSGVLIAQTEEENHYLKDIDKAFIGYYISVDFMV